MEMEINGVLQKELDFDAVSAEDIADPMGSSGNGWTFRIVPS